MVWLYVPGLSSTGSPSVPGLAGSNSPSDLCGEAATAASAWWRGKPMRRQHWSRAWKKALWTRLLSGMTCEPSHSARCAEEWISSLPASPASPPAPPAGGGGSAMSAGSGPRYGGWLAAWDAATCSWRTSRDCSLFPGEKPSEPSCPTWPKAGGLHGGCVYRLRRWAPPTGGSGSSCWPTHTVNSDGDATANRGISLPRAAERWWPTPRSAENGNDSGSAKRRQQGANPGLKDAAALWSTPRASDGEKGGPGQTFGAGGVPLASQTALWGTPGANIGSESAALRPSRVETGRTTEYLGRQVAMLYSPSSPQAPATSPPGGPSSERAPGSPPPSPRRRLNPHFVAWLMGFPPWWAIPALMPSALTATPWSLSRGRWRSLSSGIGCTTTAEEGQP